LLLVSRPVLFGGRLLLDAERYGERKEHPVTLDAIPGVELVVPAQIEGYRVRLALRKLIGQFRPDAEDATLEVAEQRRTAAVRGQLFVPLADDAQREVVWQVLLAGYFEMHLVAGVVVRIRVLAIERKAEYGREFTAALEVGHGVGDARVESPPVLASDRREPSLRPTA
jgi:hypothetical protein